MSRFFTTGSDSESESSLSGEELVTKPVGGNYGKQPLLLSEDEEDTKRVVRSAKDKRFEELTNLIRTIRNAMKIRDVTKCLEEFELLGKAYGKAKSIVDKEGVPRFYIRILADLEDYLNELWEDKEGKKKMNKYIYAKDRTDRIRTCAILCHIYHHALHSRWYQARDLMLMSHLQDNIQHADPPVQILYNRTMVQLGICAFRQGLTKDAHNALLDIQSSGRAKELLGQGLLLRSLQERNQEQEKVERRRQVPFHLHINLELLECVYLVSAMLLEIPYMAAHESDARRRMISKQFHHQLRVGERQPLLGPPESMREHVVAASKAMKMGDWKTCHSFIINEKMNGKVWDLFPEADKVRTMLVRKIQEESLRTYLFTYSSVYDSISMETLSDMFELDLPTVHSIISKMIINEELMASLDQPTQTVVMHRTEPTAQQNLALQLAEKLGSLVENNERVFDHKQGTYGGYFRDQKDGYRKNEGYMRRGGYRQQQSQTAY
uniref:PCI domain-containing protein n=1 Tax=Rousettus aegyptiacus TaxID=9407 RepID=A0A7J8F0I3_ROUAE|nr:hypothetical protein HJG63_012281 [Rousettus aegyptiacus]